MLYLKTILLFANAHLLALFSARIIIKVLIKNRQQENKIYVREFKGLFISSTPKILKERSEKHAKSKSEAGNLKVFTELKKNLLCINIKHNVLIQVFKIGYAENRCIKPPPTHFSLLQCHSEKIWLGSRFPLGCLNI